MNLRVVVTGIGVISPVGLDFPTAWTNLISGRSAIQPITSFDPSNFEVRIAGEAHGFDPLCFMSAKEARRTERLVHFAAAPLEEALAHKQPEIFNTDQGSQFTSRAFTGRLEQSGIAVSMDGRGRALDNVFIERLWRTVKYEDIYSKHYETPRAVQRGLDTCAAVLVVIGSKWLNVVDKKGRRRLDVPDDWVRHEVAESLRRPGVRVFPVLVGDADMPGVDDLPAELQSLTRRQAFPLTVRHWGKDIAELVEHLRRVPGLDTRFESGPLASETRQTETEEQLSLIHI